MNKLRSLPLWFKLFGAFLVFAAVMAAYAGGTLSWPGTPLDEAWRLNPAAHRQMGPYGWRIGLGFVLLSTVLVVCTVGWFKKRRWGWQLAVIVIATQVAGDAFNMWRGDYIRGGTGLFLASGLLAFLLRQQTRSYFQ